MTIILGIESSCDETAAGIITDKGEVLANVIASQVDVHKIYGGVVPEIASRQHLLAISPTVEEAMQKAGLVWQDLDAVAVTQGPGLVGALLVGLSYGKGLAQAIGKPIIGVHHLEGHLLVNFIEHPNLQYPFLALIVSGSHSDIVLAKAPGRYQLLGQSRDDAAGEAFDKISRAIGLGYPGGPAIQKAAQNGDPQKYTFPRAWLEADSFDFSFSGLKSAILNFIRQCEKKGEIWRVEDVAASVQMAICDVLSAKAIRAARLFGVNTIVLAGGVAANSCLRNCLRERADGLQILWPSPIYCTDNGVMIAQAALRKWEKKDFADFSLNACPGLQLYE